MVTLNIKSNNVSLDAASNNVRLTMPSNIKYIGTPLEPATTEKLGGIIVGDNLTITEEGVLSAAAKVVWEEDL